MRLFLVPRLDLGGIGSKLLYIMRFMSIRRWLSEKARGGEKMRRQNKKLKNF